MNASAEEVSGAGSPASSGRGIAMAAERIAARRVRLDSMFGLTSVGIQGMGGIKPWESWAGNPAALTSHQLMNTFGQRLTVHTALRFERTLIE